MKKKSHLRLGTVNILLTIFILITLVIIVNMCLTISGGTHTDAVINITQTAPDRPGLAPSGEQNSAETPTSPQSKTEEESSNAKTESEGSTDAKINVGGSGSTPEDSKEGEALRVFDKDKTWSTTTDINIFEHNDPRVKSDGTGEAKHVIAPGTSNTYTFTVANDKDFPIAYKLTIEGGNDSRFTIPIWVQVTSPDGADMTGGKVLLKEFKEIGEFNTLKAGQSKLYSIWWEWPFERGEDEYDTSLGDTAVDEEIACHMTINVLAEYDLSGDTSVKPVDVSSEPEESVSDVAVESKPGDAVLTGDSLLPAVIFTGLLVAAAIVMVILVASSRKKKKDEDN